MRNGLYEINAFNKNLFAFAGSLGVGNTPLNPLSTKSDIHVKMTDPQGYLNSTNIFGISKLENPLSKYNISHGIGAMAKTGIGSSILSGVSSAASGFLQNTIGGELHSGVGNAVGDLGRGVGNLVGRVNPLLGTAINVGSGILAGGINAIGGTKVDEKALAQANNAINTLNNYKSSAKYYDDIQGIEVFGGIKNPYSGGLTRKGWAEDRNQELRNSYANALSFAERSRENNVHNIFGDMLSDYAANYSALGGSLTQPYTGALGLMQQNRYIDAIDRRTDAIAKTNNNNMGTFGATTNRFDAGGSFVSNFMEDPVSAAMQYIQERDAEDAAAEAQAEAAAQQAAYDDMQQRLAAAETQNQGLQALIDSQGLDIKTLMENQRQYTDSWRERMPESNPTDSPVLTRIRQGLIDRGINRRAHQDAILANIMVESKGNLNAKNNTSSARGLLQWLKDRHPKAWDFDSQMDYIANTYNQFGGNNWLDKKAWQRFNNTNDSIEAARLFRQYYERPEKHTYNWTDKYINQMYGRKAFGGELGTNGTDFTNGLLEINAGGSHEDNAYGGVLMGYDNEGIPNFVEEGETVFNDYVYSNRLTVPDFMHKELGLGGSKKELTFADASKILAKDSVERPNNPIDQAGLMASLGKLAQIQETERARIQTEDMNTEMEEPMRLMAAYGGNLFAGGGEKEALNWVNRKFPNAKNKQAIARAIWRKANSNRGLYYRPKVSIFGKSDPNPRWDFDTVYNSMIPTIQANSERYFNEWMNNGLSADDAYLMINRGERPKSQDLLYDWNKQKERFIANRNAAKPYEGMKVKGNAQKQPYQGPDQQQYFNNNGGAVWNNQSSSNTAANKTSEAQLYRAKNGKLYKSQQAADIANERYDKQVADYQASQREALQRNETQVQTQAQTAPATAQRANTGTQRAAAAQQSAPSRAVGNARTRRVSNTQTAAPQNSGDGRHKGDIVDYKYDWYRNGDDGTGRHWGFTPNENGIIDTNTGYTDEYRNLVSTLTADDIRAWAAEHPNDPSLQSFLANNGADALKNLTTEQWRRGATDGKYGFMHHVAAEIGANPQDLPTAEEYNRAIGEGGDYVNNNNPFRIVGMSRIGQQTPSMEWGRDEYGNRLRLITPAESTDTPTATDNSPSGIRGEVAGGGRPTYATWMRYAPIFGTGIMALSDALGLTNKPDYTYANKLEAAANRAGIAPNIEAPAIGDYMRYDPFDRLFYANQLQANARATDRSIENNAGMNRGTAMAAQIANGYNTNLNLGNLDRQGDEYNRGQYERKKEYDRRTNLINAQMQLEADMANARFAQQAASANLSGLAQAAAMRDSIDQRVGAARSANITNFLNNMGNLGRENFAFNQINWDRSRRYGARKNGVSYYWPSSNITAFGGEIEKMKRNRKNKK